jgi:hypothetical protein
MSFQSHFLQKQIIVPDAMDGIRIVVSTGAQMYRDEPDGILPEHSF